MLARKITAGGAAGPNPKTATESQLRQFPAAAMPISDDYRFGEASRVLRELNAEIAAARRSIQKLQGAAWLHSQAEEEGLSGPQALEQAQRLEAIRGEASAAAGERVKVRHRKALLDILRAARLLAMASNAELAIRGELLQNGYEILDAYTPPPRFAVPLLLGEEHQSGSALWHFRQQLEELGILSSD